MSACIKSGGALETADSTTGVIVVNGITAVRALNRAWAGQYHWHFRLEAKDGHYTYTFTNTRHSTWGDLHKPSQQLNIQADLKGLIQEA